MNINKIISVFTCLCLFQSSYASNEDSLQFNFNKTLQEITISATHNHYAGNSNKKKFNPDKLVNNKNQTLNEILNMIPSLEIDMDGNIRMRGSEKLQILINGLPNSLMGDYRSEVLIQMPAFAIESIEVNNIPPTSQLPDGMAGTINIITKQGYSNPTLSINSAIANGDRYNAGLNFALPLNKISIAGNLAIKREYRERKFDNLTIKNPTDEAKKWTQTQDNTANAHPFSIFNDIHLYYNPNQKNCFGIDFNFYRMSFNRIGNIHNIETQKLVPKLKEINVIRDNSQINSDVALTANYTHKFDRKNELLKIDATLRKSKYDENNYYDRNIIITNPIQKKDNSFINQDIDEADLNFLYQKSFNKMQLKTGYNGRLLKGKNPAIKEFFEPVTAITPSLINSDQFDLNQSIQAVFLQMEKKFSVFDFTAGLRMEQTNIKSNLSSTDNHVKQNYFNLYPSFEMNYKISALSTLSLNYGRRINRPVTSDLNPYLNTGDPARFTTGNPLLKPELIDNVSFGYQFHIQSFTLTSTLFARNQQNTIGDWITVENNNTTATRANLDNTQSAGGELTTTVHPLKWISLSANATVYYEQIDGRNLGLSERNGNWGWNTQAIAGFFITPTISAQCNGFYISDLITPQGKIKARFKLDAGIRQSLFQKKLILSFLISDLFNSASEITIINTPTVYKMTRKKRDAHIFTFGLSYTI